MQVLPNEVMNVIKSYMMLSYGEYHIRSRFYTRLHSLTLKDLMFILENELQVNNKTYKVGKISSDAKKHVYAHAIFKQCCIHDFSKWFRIISTVYFKEVVNAPCMSLIDYRMLPTSLYMDSNVFRTLWNMIPTEYNYIWMYGKKIQAPRKYKVYGKSYKFTGMNDTIVDPVPCIIQPYLNHVNTLDNHVYNSVLINWYEGEDYIGFHSDNISNLVEGSNIHGISFGENRTLRFKDNSNGNNIDYVLEHNSIITMKHGCQDMYKHSILKSKKLVNKRINITFRAVC